MPPNFKDFSDRFLAKREADRKQALFQRETQLRQAAVKAELLMQHEGWDYFLSVLQDRLNETRAGEVEWAEKAACAVLPHDITIAQRNYAVYRAQADLLEEVMSLPSRMKGDAVPGQP